MAVVAMSVFTPYPSLFVELMPDNLAKTALIKRWK